MIGLLYEILARLGTLLGFNKKVEPMLQQILAELLEQKQRLVKIEGDIQALGQQLADLIELVNPTKPVRIIFVAIIDGKEEIFEGDRVMILKAGQSQALAIKPVDRFGNVAKFDTTNPPRWTSSNPEVATVTANPDDNMAATLVSVGKVGNAQCNVVIDANLGPEDAPVIGVLDLEVQPGDAVSVTIEPVGLPIDPAV